MWSCAFACLILQEVCQRVGFRAKSGDRRHWMCVIYDDVCRKAWARRAYANDDTFDVEVAARSSSTELLKDAQDVYDTIAVSAILPVAARVFVHCFVFRQPQRKSSRMTRSRREKRTLRCSACLLQFVCRCVHQFGPCFCSGWQPGLRPKAQPPRRRWLWRWQSRKRFRRQAKLDRFLEGQHQQQPAQH